MNVAFPRIVMMIILLIALVSLIYYWIIIRAKIAYTKKAKEEKNREIELLQKSQKKLDIDNMLISLLFGDKPLILLGEILKEKKVQPQLILEYLKRIPKIGPLIDVDDNITILSNLSEDEINQVNFIFSQME